MTKEKNELMAESSHAFFRASPALFYHDLKTTYANRAALLPRTAPNVAVLGDAHVLNAGTFRGPEGRPVWGLNDYDQAEVGSPEVDLQRLGVSLYVAARSQGLNSEESSRLVEAMAQSYLASAGESGPAFLSKDETEGPIRKLIGKVEDKDQKEFLAKWVDQSGRKLVRGEDLFDPDPSRGAQLQVALSEKFPDLKFLDLTSKPHSGGSTRGLERYYSLVESPDRSLPWILETKAVLPSPVQTPDGDLRRGDGDRILSLQKEMGGMVDSRHRAFKLGNTAFFTREREREKGSLKEKPEHLQESAPALGKLLARAHSAQGGQSLKEWIGSDGETLTSNLTHFCRLYARQVESDFREWQGRFGNP